MVDNHSLVDTAIHQDSKGKYYRCSDRSRRIRDALYISDNAGFEAGHDTFDHYVCCGNTALCDVVWDRNQSKS